MVSVCCVYPDCESKKGSKYFRVCCVGIQVDTDKVAESQQAQDMKRTEKLRGGFIAGLDATNARK